MTAGRVPYHLSREEAGGGEKPPKETIFGGATVYDSARRSPSTRPGGVDL